MTLSKTLYPLLSTDSTRIKTGNHTNMTKKLCEEHQLVHVYSNVVITSNLAAMVNVLKKIFFSFVSQAVFSIDATIFQSSKDISWFC